MKLVVIIPAYNEEKTISRVIAEIPRKITGIDCVEVIVINDGSKDRTKELALLAGADKVITNKKNLGLAPSFRRGIEEALKSGADIIVNIDADLQYDATEIPKIIYPILVGQADIVLTDRKIWSLSHMPLEKKIGNSIATKITSIASGFNVKDAQSGFRAFSRDAALLLNVTSNYTYVQETIIQAAEKRLKIVQIPVKFRKRVDKSRLIGNIFSYAKKAGITIIRNYTRYHPLRLFLSLGLIFFSLGFIIGIRFLYYSLIDQAQYHTQSIMLTTLLVIVGFLLIVLGLIADSIYANRQINEEILYRIKKREFDNFKKT